MCLFGFLLILFTTKWTITLDVSSSKNTLIHPRIFIWLILLHHFGLSLKVDIYIKMDKWDLIKLVSFGTARQIIKNKQNQKNLKKTTQRIRENTWK